MCSRLQETQLDIKLLQNTFNIQTMEIEEKHATRSCQHNLFTLAGKTYVNSTATVRFKMKLWKHSVSLSD